MSTIIKPTVGRKVWYRPSQFDVQGPGGMQMAGSPDRPDLSQPLDATILAVWSDTCINVLVFDITGKPFTKMSTRLLQEGDAKPVDAAGKPVGGYVEWMPYQQGQAKKDAAIGPATAQAAA